MSSQRHEPDLIREWLDETYEAEREPGRFLDRVVDSVPTTPQRQRRWWHRVRPGLTQTPTATSTNEFQPSPIPATNGHTPTVIGRTQSMFSPVKAITAAALVFAIGGVLFVAQPFQQQGSVPGAELQPPPAPVPFTSTYGWSGRSTPGSVEKQEDGTIVTTGVGWMFDGRDASDRRFAGPLVLTMTDIEYPEVGGSVAVGGYRVETADGAWQQTPKANLAFEEDYAAWASGSLPPAGNIQFWTFVGEGDYEGLTAVVQETWTNGTVQFDGFIFEGDLWEAPEPWVP